MPVAVVAGQVVADGARPAGGPVARRSVALAELAGGAAAAMADPARWLRQAGQLLAAAR